ncbi:unnamed protein product [Spirodela intermedia]|uniref:Exocyst subunit Exo70 family protein n=1 Tax=Spirodela intermedia TaxID=51605 RepID=A0A7I8LDZ6_SPIIN|nr:unnamed protein product [Spirodela intermedia]
MARRSSSLFRGGPKVRGGGGGGGIENLLAVRRSLESILKKSRALASAVENAGLGIDEIYHRLPDLEAAVRPSGAPKGALAGAGSHIGRAVSPGSVVLKVFDALHGLEPFLLTDPLDDLQGYLSVLKRLEEAIQFLGDNCGHAIQWLEDSVDYLEESSLADDRYLARLRTSLKSLKDSKSPLDGGLLDAALERLESAFRRLLVDSSVSLALALPSSKPLNAIREDQKLPQVIAPSPLPMPVIQQLLSILDRLSANGRVERCSKIYAEVRGSNAQATLGNLGLDYLSISAQEFVDVRRIDVEIVEWMKHLEFAVKHVLEAEFKLCYEIFGRFGPPDFWKNCFADIATQAGLLSFLQFGMTVTESRTDPDKLLKLLEIFGFLNRLRSDFNRLFGMKPCAKIQSITRDLIKRVIDGACEIFFDLHNQAKSQGQRPPPSDGGVPKVVTFLVDYCNRLLGDDHKPLLTQVLDIHQSWRGENLQEGLVTKAIMEIIVALERNLEAWSKAYDDATLSYIFSINTHSYFYRQLKGTRLGDLLDDQRLRDHDALTDYYSTLYLRNCWGRLPPFLSRKGLILVSKGRAATIDLVKKRFTAFNEAFDEIHRKHSVWVIPDKDLREKLSQLAVQTVVPVYRSFLQSYGSLVKQDSNSDKHIKHTAESLENSIGSLFQHKPARSPSLQAAQSNGKVNDAARINQYQSPPAR